MSAYLTEEEVWLRAYVGGLTAAGNIVRDRVRRHAKHCAEDAVVDWKERFGGGATVNGSRVERIELK